MSPTSLGNSILRGPTLISLSFCCNACLVRVLTITTRGFKEYGSFSIEAFLESFYTKRHDLVFNFIRWLMEKMQQIVWDALHILVGRFEWQRTMEDLTKPPVMTYQYVLDELDSDYC